MKKWMLILVLWLVCVMEVEAQPPAPEGKHHLVVAVHHPNGRVERKSAYAGVDLTQDGVTVDLTTRSGLFNRPVVVKVNLGWGQLLTAVGRELTDFCKEAHALHGERHEQDSICRPCGSSCNSCDKCAGQRH